MLIAGSLRVRARSDQDVHDIVRWVPDPAALYLFSGPRLTWPLSAQQLHSLTGTTAGMTPSVVVSPAGELVGHFDLTLDESIARLGRLIVNPSLRGRGARDRRRGPSAHRGAAAGSRRRPTQCNQRERASNPHVSPSRLRSRCGGCRSSGCHHDGTSIGRSKARRDNSSRQVTGASLDNSVRRVAQ